MKEIKLTKGKVAKVDDADFEWLSKITWQYQSAGYACHGTTLKGKRQSTLMHRAIMQPTGKQVVDHINGDPLDNQRSNLRIASRSKNAANSVRHRDNQCGLKGVMWNDGGWCPRIFFEGKGQYFGNYRRAEHAAMVYDWAAELLFGEFAKTNFPKGCVVEKTVPLRPLPGKQELDRVA